MAKTKEYREFEKRVNALRFDLTVRAKEAYQRGEDRKQEVGKDAQYWIEIGTSTAFFDAVHLLEKSLESKLDMD